LAGPSEIVPLVDVSVVAPEHAEVRPLLPELCKPPVLLRTGAAEGCATVPLLATGAVEGCASPPLLAPLEL
jgi:hypothetical protein